MKQSTIIKAYKVLNKLYEANLPLPVSYKLFKLRAQLAPQWNFQVEKEQEILSKYNPTVGEDGEIKFNSDDERDAFTTEFAAFSNEMSELDADVGEISKITLSLSSGINLSMEDIEALQDFVDFEE